MAKRPGRIHPVRILGAAFALSMVTSCDGTKAPASADPEAPHLRNFVLLAERSIQIGKSSLVVGGDSGVIAVATTGFGTQLAVGKKTFVDPHHALIASSVELGEHAFVGDVFTSSLSNEGARVGSVEAFPSPMPQMPLAPASSCPQSEAPDDENWGGGNHHATATPTRAGFIRTGWDPTASRVYRMSHRRQRVECSCTLIAA